MTRIDPRESWHWTAEQLQAWQLEQLNAQLAEVLPLNAFYQRKFGDRGLQLQSLDQLNQLPLTTKQELVDAQQAHGLSDHHTYASQHYVRVHRTSGTRGVPMILMDTVDDWQWWADTWQHVLLAAGVTAGDRVFLAFSFGPFIGFWSAYEACVKRGLQIIPGGGLSTAARLEFMRQTRPSVVACTPSYALQLAEVAERSGFDLRDLGVRCLIVAGEPGGSIPSVRAAMAERWSAGVIDHCGATEVGPWGFGPVQGGGVHVIETSFIAELLPPETPVSDSSIRELVLTSLGRWGAPVMRYRTGDLVRALRPTDGDCRFLWLAGGILGRADDMVVVRGVNVFPSSIEAVVREFPEVAEYRVQVRRRGQLDDLLLEVEVPPSLVSDLVQAISRKLDVSLGLRIEVVCLPEGSLPRTEGKARRWIDQRFTA